MERKRKLPCKILICILLSACSRICHETEVEIVPTGIGMGTRAYMPDEDKISDMNLLIFDSYGRLEYSSYTGYSDRCSVTLLKGEKYSIHAFLNFGQKIKADSIEDLKETACYLAYPDEYRNGIPMYGCKEIVIGGQTRIEVEVERMMAKISIRLDRSRLSEDVKMDITSVRIGNCPKIAYVQKGSRASSADDCFTTGFLHTGAECSPLNTEGKDRISGWISLYMLENMQGQFSEEGIGTDEEKIFEEYDIRNTTCSFIEVEMDYSSPLWTSLGKPLTYRFYLGEDRNSLDIERNCHYHITISPEDDGLHGDGWRIDKTGLKYIGETGLVKYPSDYIRGDIGDTIHLGCILTPDHAPFDIGIDYLEDDKAEGIYDYVIDPDGHGVTLTLTGPGRGLLYMEAGDPINEAALFIVEVNLPE